MSESSTTSRHTVGVVAHAIRAIAAHMFDHDLPVPLSIQFHTDSAAVLVHVDSDPKHLQAWTLSLHVDQVGEVRRGRTTHITWHGRLPDSGVRVDLLSVHFDALVSVPA